MANTMEQMIAQSHYVKGQSEEDICKRFNLRPKTVKAIINKYKAQYADNDTCQ